MTFLAFWNEVGPTESPGGLKGKSIRAPGLHLGGQNGPKINQKRHQFLDQILEGIFEGLLMNLGAIFGAFLIKMAIKVEKGVLSKIIKHL